jgi:rhamnogalacturonan acetylesterase
MKQCPNFFHALVALGLAVGCGIDKPSLQSDASSVLQPDAAADMTSGTGDAPASRDVNYPDGILLPPSTCVRVNDPSFNLDAPRPRVDPTLRDPMLTTLFIVGDSTAKNHNIQQEGWGDVLDACFDASKIQIVNWAREGRSSRTFIEEGLWARVLLQMKSGDYVMVQFGHNDQSTLETRGSIPGAGDEVQTVVNSTTLQSVTVHTYGWYLRQYAADVNAKAANLIYVTPVPRNYWFGNSTMNNTVMAQYVGWMSQIAGEAQLPVLDLNTAMVTIYTALGQSAVAYYFTSGDNTHTNLMGAERIGAAVIEGVAALATSNLNSFLLK